jgi:hypothetical protein
MYQIHEQQNTVTYETHEAVFWVVTPCGLVGVYRLY